MPRYHLKVRGSDLSSVKKAVADIAVKGQVKSEAGAVTVVVDAKDAKAAKALVDARLPKGSGAVVGRAKRVKD